MSSGVEHSLEVECKYDVDADTPLPDWSALPGVVTVGDAEPRELDALYLDTATASLAHARTALRRRSGGPDEGWHIKRVTPEGKRESRWPLAIEGDGGAPSEDSSIVVVPAPILEALAEVAAPPFGAIARIRNSRTAYALMDASGALVAEFVDDRVIATDLARGVETRWREWELELGPAAPADFAGRSAFFTVAALLVSQVGGVPSMTGSKLGRALGA